MKYFSNNPEIGLIFTLPNSDTYNFKIIDLIKKFVKKNKNSKCYKFLGKKNYFSIVKQVDVLGNSSSGISEIPSLKKPTINIGLRQEGRIKAKSIIDIKKISLNLFRKSLLKIKTKKFQKILKNVKNPYFRKNSSDRVLKILEKANLNNMKLKEFIDIKERK